MASFGPSTLAASLDDRAQYRIPTTLTVPKLDGVLDDSAWVNALKTGAFARFTGATREFQQTEGFVTTDGTSLYIGIYCHDKNPELIRASETQRGSAAVVSDDHVFIIIDSQFVHRGASVFRVNVKGTQQETIEGGTAGNITWSGNWFAATRRVADGWICEMQIPFKLLRHQPNAKSIGLTIGRNVAREGTGIVWPPIPPQGQDPSAIAQYMAMFTMDRAMPDVRPKPVFLPFVLSSADQKGASSTQGLDIKYPLSPTLTSLISISPGFRTVEQQVANLGFSYNEQYVEDRRPFFSEGAEFLPEPSLFYSQRVSNFDIGTKVVGRQGATAIGFLASSMRSGGMDRDTSVVSVKQNVGLFSDFGFASTLDNLYGIVASRTLKGYGNYGWVSGDRRNRIALSRGQSWVGIDSKGGSSFAGFFSEATRGKLGYSLTQKALSSDFISTLGLLSNPDSKETSIGLGIGNQFEKGKIFEYGAGIEYKQANRLTTGNFFYESLDMGVGFQNHRGLGTNINVSSGRRQQVAGVVNQDRFLSNGIGWNQRRLFQGGGMSFGNGRQGGFPVHSFGIGQEFFMRKGFTMGGRYSIQQYGSITTRQAIVAGTYRVDSLRSVSGRLVSQNGTGNLSAIGSQVGTNIYFAYEQRSPNKGIDLFVILGDPNAAKTFAGVTVKISKPY